MLRFGNGKRVGTEKKKRRKGGEDFPSAAPFRRIQITTLQPGKSQKNNGLIPITKSSRKSGRQNFRGNTRNNADAVVVVDVADAHAGARGEAPNSRLITTTINYNGIATTRISQSWGSSIGACSR